MLQDSSGKPRPPDRIKEQLARLNGKFKRVAENCEGAQRFLALAELSAQAYMEMQHCGVAPEEALRLVFDYTALKTELRKRALAEAMNTQGASLAQPLQGGRESTSSGQIF